MVASHATKPLPRSDSRPNRATQGRTLALKCTRIV